MEATAITGMVSPMLAIAEPKARLRLVCNGHRVAQSADQQREPDDAVAGDHHRGKDRIAGKRAAVVMDAGPMSSGRRR
jgi:hypothetical protein